MACTCVLPVGHALPAQVTCETCGREYRTYDPFNQLQVPSTDCLCEQCAALQG